MQQITISKNDYDCMVVALVMVAMAVEAAESGKVDAEALRTALEAANFPAM